MANRSSVSLADKVANKEGSNRKVWASGDSANSVIDAAAADAPAAVGDAADADNADVADAPAAIYQAASGCVSDAAADVTSGSAGRA